MSKINKLSNDVKKKIDQVSEDKQVQLSILHAMFHECERGTDLWEALEEDSHKFSKKISKLLWGQGGLYMQSSPTRVIEALIDAVEEKLAFRGEGS